MGSASLSPTRGLRMEHLGLLGVFAHPDDEQLMSGTFAKAAAEGIRTGLICATRGELGEIAEPDLATPENLGRVREGEMRAACAVLGIKYLWFLDYRDSGMMGTPGNDDPTSFYRTNDEEALSKIVKLVRDFKPTVMVTFDETGGYGHPDHLTIYRLATEAFHAAGDLARYPEAGEAWQPARLYYASFPRSMIKKIGDLILELGLETGYRDLDSDKLGIPDEDLTNAIDVREWVDIKERSLRMHRTQMDPNSPLFTMPPDWQMQIRSTEYFALAAGLPLPETEKARGDLFAGLR
jgi:LmbE family N-acetylglucosaminyl deacetylase